MLTGRSSDPTFELTAPAAYFHQERLAPAALARVADVLAPGDGPIAGALAPLALGRALLDAQRALLAGDGPGELRAYLAAFAAAPTLPTVRWARPRSRVSAGAGDIATAGWIENQLR